MTDFDFDLFVIGGGSVIVVGETDGTARVIERYIREGY